MKTYSSLDELDGLVSKALTRNASLKEGEQPTTFFSPTLAPGLRERLAQLRYLVIDGDRALLQDSIEHRHLPDGHRVKQIDVWKQLLPLIDTPRLRLRYERFRALYEDRRTDGIMVPFYEDQQGYIDRSQRSALEAGMLTLFLEGLVGAGVTRHEFRTQGEGLPLRQGFTELFPLFSRHLVVSAGLHSVLYHLLRRHGLEAEILANQLDFSEVGAEGKALDYSPYFITNVIKAERVETLMKHLSLSPGNCLFIGSSAYDLEYMFEYALGVLVVPPGRVKQLLSQIRSGGWLKHKFEQVQPVIHIGGHLDWLVDLTTKAQAQLKESHREAAKDMAEGRAASKKKRTDASVSRRQKKKGPKEDGNGVPILGRQ